MHPRITRSRPVIYLGRTGCNIIVNNINSPGFLKPLLKAIASRNEDEASDVLWADALSCVKIPWKASEKRQGSALELLCFLVEFWDEKEHKPGAVLSVEVYAPSHWSAQMLLNVVEMSIKKNKGRISVLNTYHLGGIDFPFNTLNTIHHEFVCK